MNNKILPKVPEDFEELNNTPTVELLRKSNKVRVVHRRFYEKFPLPLTKEQASGVKMVMDIGNVYPCGGFTEVFITKGKKTLRGIAECSLTDNFNRKKGVKIATYRALSKD